ncbi:hypothetical protein D3C83_73650 [compost metagenome]
MAEYSTARKPVMPKEIVGLKRSSHSTQGVMNTTPKAQTATISSIVVSSSRRMRSSTV